MSIEELNQRIISCRMLKKELQQEYNTTQPVIHENVLAGVRDYHRYFGLPDKWMIWRSRRNRDKREQLINKQFTVKPTKS